MKSVMVARLHQARRLGAAMLSAAILNGAAAAQAQQFSAEIVMQRGGVSTPAGRLRVLDRKLRLETPELSDGFFLVDAAKPAAYFVRPGARIYMDARQSSQLTRLLIPLDPDVPCRQWQAMADLAGLGEGGDWHCERTGEETIDGRTATIFRALPAAGPAFSGSIDRERKIPLRIRNDDGTVIALENIKDEPQSASSFDLPPGVRKFSPEALIEQIKQSDVWVANPKERQRP